MNSILSDVPQLSRDGAADTAKPVVKEAVMSAGMCIPRVIDWIFQYIALLQVGQLQTTRGQNRLVVVVTMQMKVYTNMIL